MPSYYFFVFGAFVALASFLPRYYVGAHGLELTTAGALAGLYSLPRINISRLWRLVIRQMGCANGDLFHFYLSLVVLLVLSVPGGVYTIQGINRMIQIDLSVSLGLFVALTAILGFAMSLGSAAVFKHIPAYYPHHVGAVGGLVGMIGGLGGFILPICFGLL